MIVLKYSSILKLSQSSMISEHLLCDENFATCFIYKIYFIIPILKKRIFRLNDKLGKKYKEELSTSTVS